jgi:cytochrome c
MHLNGLGAIKLTQINNGPLPSHYPALVPISGQSRELSAMLRPILHQALLTLMLATSALAASPSEERGKAFALNNCARCHSIDRVTQSPLKIAPPFRALHKRYPIETLAESLAEGIQTGHPTMPEFRLDPDQIHDLLSYLKSLE